MIVTTTVEIISFLVSEHLITMKEYSKVSKYPNRSITGAAETSKAIPGEISWIPEYNEQIFNGDLLICPIDDKINNSRAVQCENPKFAMAKVLDEFFKENDNWIPENQLINYQESTIQNVEIGSNVIIGPNCCVGIAGQGYAKDTSGQYFLFPHLGKVIIKDNVTIGANTVICRGALQNTIIGKGTKIGNQVNIGHNVKIGKNVMIIAGALICGSVEIGDNVWIGPGAKILNKIKIGKGAQVGIGSVVIKDVPEFKTVIGNPARIIK